MQTAPQNITSFPIESSPSEELLERFAQRSMHDRDECDARRFAQHVNSPADSVLYQTILCATNRLRTPPLWGLHLRSRFMHDGESIRIEGAILRHKGEAEGVTARFQGLSKDERDNLLRFLGSL